jgi:hypothetical protein
MTEIKPLFNSFVLNASLQIVVNGVALGGDFENLERYVCAASPPDTR